MASWLLPAALASISWALWAFFLKIASFSLPPREVYFWEVIGMAAGLGLSFLYTGLPKTMDMKGISLAVVAGLFIILGEPLFVIAVSRGKASVVTTLVTLYPLLTIILAVLFLHEVITLKQGLGMILASVALVLLTI